MYKKMQQSHPKNNNTQFNIIKICSGRNFHKDKFK